MGFGSLEQRSGAETKEDVLAYKENSSFRSNIFKTQKTTELLEFLDRIDVTPIDGFSNSKSLESKNDDFEIREKTKTIRALKSALDSARKERDSFVSNHRKELDKIIKAQQEENKKSHGRHLTFIDKLLADKKKLAVQIENLSNRVKTLQEEHKRTIKNLEQKYEENLNRAKIVLEERESSRRKVWEEAKTRELKESTIKGLEPEIQKLMAQHRRDLVMKEEGFGVQIAENKQEQEKEMQKALGEARAEANVQLRVAIEAQRKLCIQEKHDEIKLCKRKANIAVKNLKDKIRNEREAHRREATQALRKHNQAIATKNEQHENELQKLKQALTAKQLELNEQEAKMLDDAKKQKLSLLETEREHLEKEILCNLRKQNEKELDKLEEKLEDEYAQKTKKMKEAVHNDSVAVVKDLHINIEKLESKLKQSTQHCKALESKLNENTNDMKSLETEKSELNEKLLHKAKKLRELKKKIENVDDWIQSKEDALNIKCRELVSEYESKLKTSTAETDRLNKLATTQRQEYEHQLSDLKEEMELTTQGIHEKVKAAIEKKQELINSLQHRLRLSEDKLFKAETYLDQQREELITKERNSVLA